MKDYEIPCQDGTDPNCEGTILIKIPREDLTSEEALELAKNGFVDIEGEDRYVFRPEGTICSACGSDVERPREAS